MHPPLYPSLIPRPTKDIPHLFQCRHFDTPAAAMDGGSCGPHPTLTASASFYLERLQPMAATTSSIRSGCLARLLLLDFFRVVRRGRDGRGRAFVCVLGSQCLGEELFMREIHVANMRECCKCSSKAPLTFLGILSSKLEFRHEKTGLRDRS